MRSRRFRLVPTEAGGNARLFGVVMVPVIALVFVLAGLATLKDISAISRLRVDVAQTAEPVRETIELARFEPLTNGLVLAVEIPVVPPAEIASPGRIIELRAADAVSDLRQINSLRFSEGDAIIATPVGPPSALASTSPASVIARDAQSAMAHARLTISDAARGLIPAREARSCFAVEDTHRAGFEPGAAQLDFGIRLARAALRQSREFVFYTDRYFPISYPGGDVPSFYGVCSDVVVRAYRELGIDLQVRVHESGVGIGDRSIDHRRVSVLKRFFAKYGEEMRVTDDGAPYRPGDVVTYFRPRNTGTRTHIAIVSELIGASGHPMIIHNRGDGVQVEDVLFGDPITGHFRYGGQDESVVELSKHALESSARMTAFKLSDRTAR